MGKAKPGKRYRHKTEPDALAASQQRAAFVAANSKGKGKLREIETTTVSAMGIGAETTEFTMETPVLNEVETAAPIFSPGETTTTLLEGWSSLTPVVTAMENVLPAPTEEWIERVDGIPLIFYWLEQIKAAEKIDAIWRPHTNWNGLSYGKLAVLLLVYILDTHSHVLCKMEGWVNKHRNVLEEVTGWQIGDKEACDDRLGRLLSVLGQDEKQKDLAPWIRLAFLYCAIPLQATRLMTHNTSRLGVN